MKQCTMLDKLIMVIKYLISKIYLREKDKLNYITEEVIRGIVKRISNSF